MSNISIRIHLVPVRQDPLSVATSSPTVPVGLRLSDWLLLSSGSISDLDDFSTVTGRTRLEEEVVL